MIAGVYLLVLQVFFDDFVIRSLCRVSEKVQGEVVEVLSQRYSYCLNKLTKHFTREEEEIV